MAISTSLGSGHDDADGMLRHRVAVEVSSPKRWTLAAVGATPVSLIGFATFGIVDLKFLSLAVLAPAVAALTILVASDRAARSLVRRAVAAGLVATLLYDLFRWQFLIAGWMDRDPIPHIGTSLGFDPGWLVGYLWRFVGNGGGLAITFYASDRTGVAHGAVYGLAVCAGLLTVLIVSPHGQDVLFPLGPPTLVVAVFGHLIYGSTLGWISQSSARGTPA